MKPLGCNFLHRTRLFAFASFHKCVQSKACNRNYGSVPKRIQSYAHAPTDVPYLYETVGAVLAKSVEKFPDRTVFIFPKENIRKTYAQFYHDAHRLASGLLAIGLNRGDRVGIWAPNVYEWTVTQFGTALAGLILVNINPAYRENELEYCLRKVGIRCLISAVSFKSQDYYGMINDVCPALASSADRSLREEKLPDLKHVVFIGENKKHGSWTFSEVQNAGGSKSDAKLAEMMNRLQPDEPVNIQFTSGTTGSPKGATLSHRNIVNNAYFVGRRLRYHETPSIICCPPPLYHCFGCVLATMNAVVHTGTVVFPSPSFDALSALKAVYAEKCTSLYGTPTMYIDMLSHPEFDRYRYDSLRTGIISGAPCPVEVCKALINKLHMSDMTVLYGTTENSPVTFQTKVTDSLERRVATVGTVLEHVEAKIVDNVGEMVSRGNVGEIWIRGHGVMLGYWNDEGKTKEAIRPAGWYCTGDLAMMDDDGYVKIVGRNKDMINRGGENIYPVEIEQILFAHPKIEDVHVIGVPDARLGETVCAWIRLRHGVECTADEIKSFCKGKMAHFKIPHYILFKGEKDFPLTVTGKVQKHVMREISKDELKLHHVRSHYEQEIPFNT